MSWYRSGINQIYCKALNSIPNGRSEGKDCRKTAATSLKMYKAINCPESGKGLENAKPR